MTSAVRSFAIVLVLSLVSANLAATVCLIECDGRTSSPRAQQPASCHEAGSSHDAAVQFTPQPAGCRADHAAPTAELSPSLDLRVTRPLVALAVVMANSSSAASPGSGAHLFPSPHKGLPAPTGAVLPLRL